MLRYMLGCSIGASAAQPQIANKPMIATAARIINKFPCQHRAVWTAVVAYQPWLNGERRARFTRYRAGGRVLLRSLRGVNSAFRFGCATPSAGARVLTSRGSAGAGHASDRQKPFAVNGCGSKFAFL